MNALFCVSTEHNQLAEKAEIEAELKEIEQEIKKLKNKGAK